jgi:EAL domain-containing protein (putative c-di-GMP-specific phosphodiesterase class I)
MSTTNQGSATLDADQVATALEAREQRPENTFLSVPVDAQEAVGTEIHGRIASAESLTGTVVEFGGRRRLPDLSAIADEIRGAGGTLALSGGESGQPPLAAIVHLRPSIITLGRDWIRNLENSSRKQQMVESVSRLASAQDAWILADDVRSDAELRTLAELGVPLAVGPFIGAPGFDWPDIDLAAVSSVPGRHRERGPLQDLLRPVLTVRSVAEAAALASNLEPEEHLVVVESNRPKALICLSQGAMEPYEIMDVNVNMSLHDALRRAEARSEAERWLPIAVTDDAGRFLGLINIDTLKD